MGSLGYTHLDQHSKEIARFRPEVIEANLSQEPISLESLVGMNFQVCTWTRAVACQIVQFSFGYSNCPLNPVFRSTAPQTPRPPGAVDGYSLQAVSFGNHATKFITLGC
jgi:hypothetical protein